MQTGPPGSATTPGQLASWAASGESEIQEFKRTTGQKREIEPPVFPAIDRVLLERLHADSRWELQPAVGWSVSDLDHDEILRTLDAGIGAGRIEQPETRDPQTVLRGLGLLKAEILEVPGAVVVRFTGKALQKTIGKTIGKTPAAVLQLLAEDPTRSVVQLADHLGKAEVTIHCAIRRLRQSGRLVRIGPAKGGHWKVVP